MTFVYIRLLAVLLDGENESFNIIEELASRLDFDWLTRDARRVQLTDDESLLIGPRTRIARFSAPCCIRSERVTMTDALTSSCFLLFNHHHHH